jgi:CDP-glucose 4,6-dehydratase
MFNNVYSGKKVLLTGHTGFKGSWLAFWLTQLGAEVCGVALPMETQHCHFDLLKPDMRSEYADIRDAEKIFQIMADFKPDVVFHLAAQPLVRLSYAFPVETFSANVMGTIHVLDACRKVDSVRAIVAISSDKCYENKEQTAGYKESDPMGGYDPYSASKGCTELVISSYRRSFFNNDEYGKKHYTLLASGRAGNVIGGGDWAADRLIPDLMRAAASGKEAVLRNPNAHRPWQHVFEPLSGYLHLGACLYSGDRNFVGGWNFGPADNETLPVQEVAAGIRMFWPRFQYRIEADANAPHEATLLRLDCSKSRKYLNWHGVWNIDKTLEMTAKWYAAFYDKQEIVSGKMLQEYISDAAKKGLIWTK